MGKLDIPIPEEFADVCRRSTQGAVGVYTILWKTAEEEREEAAGLRAEIADLEGRCAKLENMVLKDPLTGAGSRYKYTDSLREQVARVERYDGDDRFGLLLVDVDDFKKINDTAGHPYGDAVLKGVADYLKKELRVPDIVCRLGGQSDEFACLCPDTDAAGLEEIRKRVQSKEGVKRLNDAVRADVESSGLQYERGLAVTVSMGFALCDTQYCLRQTGEAVPYKPAEGTRRRVREEEDNLLKNISTALFNEADESLYSNKRDQEKRRKALGFE